MNPAFGEVTTWRLGSIRTPSRLAQRIDGNDGSRSRGRDGAAERGLGRGRDAVGPLARALPLAATRRPARVVVLAARAALAVAPSAVRVRPRFALASALAGRARRTRRDADRKSKRLNSSHVSAP